MQRQHLVIFFMCFGSLFCDLSKNSFLLVGFKSIRKCLVKKFIQEKDLKVKNVLICCGHESFYLG